MQIIIMESPRPRIHKVLYTVPSVCCVAVLSASLPWAASRRTETGAIWILATAASVSVLCWRPCSKLLNPLQFFIYIFSDLFA